ncbi:hypothetical protein E1B28_001504 [Marasmius oreades]|uniref:Uncharacterized protein n=1 Tax=Marasmius oreades TaxID=181124 RepID=A0A9P7V3K5_9AGAR|nr:uncharacterized protein E1B28_001504 [Marasmius oreades]KAG7099680.1 hypothetical protein E1B28_001504 [Marasmius oreades]
MNMTINSTTSTNLPTGQADFDFLNAQLTSPQVQGELDFGLFGLDSTMLNHRHLDYYLPTCPSRIGSALNLNSPLQRFRQTSHLSVADLVSPAYSIMGSDEDDTKNCLNDRTPL